MKNKANGPGDCLVSEWKLCVKSPTSLGKDSEMNVEP